MQTKRISLIFILLLCFCQITLAQSTFQKGYFINLQNDTVQCYIKNLDWRSEPQKISIKKELSQKDHQTVSKEEMLEFEIFDQLKYIKVMVDVDRTSQNIKTLSYERQPKFEKEEVFLKEIYHGDVLLYEFHQKEITYFYLKGKEGEILPLVYKEYFGQDKFHVHKNEYYQQQLLNLFENDGATIKDVKKLNYEASSLIKFLSKFSSESKITENKIEKTSNSKGGIKFSLRPGFTTGSYIFEKGNKNNQTMDGPIDFGSNTQFKIGVEVEVAFGFNHQKWRLYLEPSYRSFSSSAQVENLNLDVKYQSLHFPLGLRYYSYLGDKWSIFYNGGLSIDQPLDSYLDRNLAVDPYKMTFSIGYHLGLGVKYNKRWGTEFRYNHQGSLFRDYQNFADNFNVFEMSLVYTIN
ncbi:outer membrane beta-barrel protein [Flammeovirga sp. MY04]|uniref:outer membrane beta-barrel protein n=1 Tax=Flammeovirga sp. MY04 TaxID=1191459 RepID=UPI0008061D5B|nr:outer membrane beta-barrel protein [Flammeovirga sp. MY04]ANQ50667.1 outer membrane beta-barrel protein [Flammeovirga sp. MY04]